MQILRPPEPCFKADFLGIIVLPEMLIVVVFDDPKGAGPRMDPPCISGRDRRAEKFYKYKNDSKVEDLGDLYLHLTLSSYPWATQRLGIPFAASSLGQMAFFQCTEIC